MSKNNARRRPFGVKVIIVLQILSLLAFFVAVSLAPVGGTIFPFSQPQAVELLLLQSQLLPILGGLTIAFQTVFILGLWQLKRWAWLLLMIQLGVSMAINLWRYHQGAPHYFDMLLDVLIVFYLNQRDVQHAFERRRRNAENSQWTI